jgi:hypothetical protein
MADGGSYANVVAAAQATAETPTGGNQAGGDQGGSAGGNQATGGQGGNGGGSQATGDHGGNVGDGQTAGDHGANNLVADLTAFFQGGGQNSVSAVLADISTLAHSAGVHGNGVATLLAGLLTGAGPPAQSGGGAPAASADPGHVDPAPAFQHATFEHMWHHA